VLQQREKLAVVFLLLFSCKFLHHLLTKHSLCGEICIWRFDPEKMHGNIWPSHQAGDVSMSFLQIICLFALD